VKLDDPYSLFDLPRRFQIDPKALEDAWRTVAAKVHPDRYATASAAERRVAMQWSSRANEAYRQLRDPLLRARYLCEAAGVDLATETNTAMDPAFLMEQMAWREDLDEVRASGSRAAFDQLSERLAEATASMQSALAHLLDDQADFEQAGAKLREWMFVEKMAHDLRDDRLSH
jgi:molecular chaperone HscB